MTDKQKALEWLYKQLKRKRIAVVLGGNDESI